MEGGERERWREGEVEGGRGGKGERWKGREGREKGTKRERERERERLSMTTYPIRIHVVHCSNFSLGISST